jgi:hypothetical protein
MSKDRPRSPFAPLLSEVEWELAQLRSNPAAIATEITQARVHDDRQAFQTGLIIWLQAL